jgi:hypothetical protein
MTAKIRMLYSPEHPGPLGAGQPLEVDLEDLEGIGPTQTGALALVLERDALVWTRDGTTVLVARVRSERVREALRVAGFLRQPPPRRLVVWTLSGASVAPSEAVIARERRRLAKLWDAWRREASGPSQVALDAAYEAGFVINHNLSVRSSGPLAVLYLVPGPGVSRVLQPLAKLFQGPFDVRVHYGGPKHETRDVPLVRLANAAAWRALLDRVPDHANPLALHLADPTLAGTP